MLNVQACPLAPQSLSRGIQLIIFLVDVKVRIPNKTGAILH